MLHLKKFARALRLRWPWLEWTDLTKLWVGMGNPCDAVDMELFYACSRITIGNEAKAPFWDTPWLDGKRPRDIAPLVFEASKRKKWTVRQALSHSAWIKQIKLTTDFSMDHLLEYLQLWAMLSHVQLNDEVEDAIS